MRPDQRPRTGKRRDDGVRVIRTESVRYPGHEHPLIDEMVSDAWNDGTHRPSRQSGEPPSASGGSRIQVRDTGLAVVGRAARLEQARARTRRRNVLIGAAIVSALLLAVMGWRYASDQRAARIPLDAGTAAVAAGLPDSSAHATPVKTGTARSATTPDGPTPIFASYAKLKLRLPVSVGKLTEVGFHQASYPWALRMKTPLKDADATKANKKRGTSRDATSQPTGENAVLVGKVLRMWRSRPGKPDTAADVGAKPGSTVYSPVSGTVVKIKSYKLYGKYPDYEMHIVPDGYDNLDIVMIHLADLEVKTGDRVVAGVTKVAHVRKLSDKFTDQLSQYTKDGGDHVHLQVNDAEYKGYKGLNGAIEPEEPTGTPAAAN